MLKIICIQLGLLTVVSVSAEAAPQTVTNNLTVQMTIVATCIVAASTLNFGSNVGVLTTNPTASLSVGNGDGIVGTGLISANAKNPSTTIDGQGTAFLSQVQMGDTIVVGYMPPQWRKIKTIVEAARREVQMNSEVESGPASRG